MAWLVFPLKWVWAWLLPWLGPVATKVGAAAGAGGAVKEAGKALVWIVVLVALAAGGAWLRYDARQDAVTACVAGQKLAAAEARIKALQVTASRTEEAERAAKIAREDVAALEAHAGLMSRRLEEALENSAGNAKAACVPREIVKQLNKG